MTKETFKKFGSYYEPHKKLFFLDLFFAFLISAIDLVFPMATREIINEIIPADRLDLLGKWALVLVVLSIIRYVSDYIVQYWGHVLGVYIEYDMRKELYAHLQTLPLSYYDNTNTGHIMSRLVNDLRDIVELAHHGPEDLFISIVMLVGSFILLLQINVVLTLIIFTAIPLLLFFTISKRINMENAFRKVRKKISNINAYLENSISGIRVVKAFTNQDYEIEKFDESNDEYKNARKESYMYMAEFMAGINVTTNLLNLLVITAGGYFVYRDWINVGDLLAYTMYVSYFIQPIRRLANLMQQLQEGMTGFERFQEVMEIEPDIVDKEDAIELEDVKGHIEFKDVSFSYDNGEARVLSNINLDIPAGKTIAVVGPSGAGKTTLCHLIPRFYDINSGAILIDGHDIRDVTIESLRKNIGIVQQDVFLFSGTFKENIAYGDLTKSFDDIVEAARNADIHDYIMTLPNRYDTNIGEKGVKLSGGQKQRLSIARLFLKNPPILILDEATSSLDNKTELMIQDALEKLAKGRTTLTIAHRLSTIMNADEIIVLTNEGIEEKGSHEELLEQGGIYKGLYQLQFR